MRVLALDTTSRGGSVALVGDGGVIAERAGDATRSHAEQLPGELLSLLEEQGVDSSAVDVFAVAAGPGSFTGLRIGIATMQGLAFVHRRGLVAVSALEAIAHTASAGRSPGTIVAAWMDAHRHDVFSALYRVAGALPFATDRLIELEAASVGSPGATLRRWEERFVPDVFAGDGAVLYASMLAGRGPVVAPGLLAGPLGRIALLRARDGQTIDPAAVHPLYVRRPDAELAREQRADQPQGTPGPQRQSSS
jgi:tRNA threonylcarbamoyladenosine biosynthesis protein TsaB